MVTYSLNNKTYLHDLSSGFRSYNSLYKVLFIIVFILTQSLMLGLLFIENNRHFSTYNMYIGIVLVVLYILLMMEKPQRIPREIILYGLYIIWGILTGIFIAEDMNTFFNITMKITRILFLALAINGLIVILKEPGIIFASFIVLYLTAVLYGYATGNLTILEYSPNPGRESAMYGNPNKFAFISILSITSLLYFWNIYKSFIVKVIISVLVTAMAFGILLSGSRKAFIAVLIFVLIWGYLTIRKSYPRIRRSFMYKMSIILIVIGMYFVINEMLQDSLMYRRFYAAIENPDIDTGRRKLYEEGFSMFKESPIMGVGFSQFTVRSIFKTFSHSDYIEILACNGIVGFILYFSIYLSIWLRLDHLRENKYNQDVIYKAGLFKALFITILFLALGRIDSQSIETWMIIAAVIGFIEIAEKSDYNQKIKYEPEKYRGSI